MPYKDIEKRREANRNSLRRYRQSEKYKEYLLGDKYKEAAVRYETSERGKATRREYQHGTGGLDAQARYRKTDKSKERNKKYLSTEKGKKYNREKSVRYRLRHPDKIKAVSMANKYLPDKLCEVGDCDNIGEKHHEDYSNPLDVNYLCKDHHMGLHWSGGVL